MSVISSKSNTSVQHLLTTGRLSAIFFVQLNEAYQITVLLPMVVFMVRDFGIQPELLGIYTSILNATFCFCQFLCCYSWGLLSDKYGRRIALLSGLIFSTIAITLFGLSKTFLAAMIARSIGGFFNGNLGVIKAYLSDITDAHNRAWAFSILAIAYGFGSVMGSMCGGIFIETHDVDVDDAIYQQTTGIIKWWIFEHKYPFLIPCIIGSMISAISFVLTLIFINDEKLNMDTLLDKNDDDNDYQSILSEKYMISTLDDEEGAHCTYSIDELAKQAMIETCAGDGLHSITLATHSLKSTLSVKSNEFQGLLMSDLNNKTAAATNDEFSYATLYSLVFDTELEHALVVWTLNIMAIMMFQEMNPVYMTQALNFTSQLIGYCMAFSGFCLLVFTYFIQPYFLNNFRFRPMCIICCIAMCFVILHMPSIFTTITEFGFINEDNSKIVSLILAFINSLAAPCFASISIICSMCWVNNSVPNTCVGRANGFAQSCACLVRAIGPSLTGFIWSGSVTHINSNKIAVYYAYLPSFVCYVVIQVWIFLYIGDDAQLMWEQRLLKTNKSKDWQKNQKMTTKLQKTTS